jgi:transcription elongation factor Elf1
MVMNDPRSNEPGSEAEETLPLPDPFPDYVPCPHCGELEVEVWCYQREATCHRCGKRFRHEVPNCFGTSERCRAASAPDELP